MRKSCKECRTSQNSGEVRTKNAGMRVREPCENRAKNGGNHRIQAKCVPKMRGCGLGSPAKIVPRMEGITEFRRSAYQKCRSSLKTNNFQLPTSLPTFHIKKPGVCETSLFFFLVFLSFGYGTVFFCVNG